MVEVTIICKPTSRAPTYKELMNSMKRWDPKKHFKTALKLAREALAVKTQRSHRESELARWVQKLVEHIERDEEAIAATLKECGGHATLAVLIVYYQAHKKSHETLKEVRLLASQALDDHNNEAPIGETLNILARIAGERKL